MFKYLLCVCVCVQWRNRRGAGGQSAPPETSDREIFCLHIGKKEARKKWKRVEGEGENCKWK